MASNSFVENIGIAIDNFTELLDTLQLTLVLSMYESYVCLTCVILQTAVPY